MGTLSSCLNKTGLSKIEKEVLRGAADDNVKDGDAAHIAAVRAVADFIERVEKERESVSSQVAEKGGIATGAPYKLAEISHLTSVLRKSQLENITKISNTESQEDSQNGSLRTNGSESLEGTSSGSVQGASAVGDSAVGSRQGSGDGAQGNIRTDAIGVSATRSGGSDSSSVHPVSTGANGRLERPSDSGRQRETEDSDGKLSGRRESQELVNPPVDGLPSPNVPKSDFVITDDVRLGEGGLVAKYNDNVSAIKLLKKLEAEQRRATPSEQKILARYVGWGGLQAAFRPFSKGWDTRGKELESILTKEELDAAARSTLDAHYTSKPVVEAMWDAARHFGFDGGIVLEPSVGIGNFLGLAPEDMRENTRFVGVELDSLTGRMVKALYPQAIIYDGVGFQDAPLANGFANLAIGNPPFGDQSLYFSGQKHLNGKSIHNQFFMGSADALAPGGLQIMVVSRYLMDAKDSGAREYLAKHMRLLGAIRLPDTAFQENANTQVVTDILFLQKRKEPMEYGSNERYGWVTTEEVADPLGGDPITVNSYFAMNPDKILGVMDRSGSMQFKNDVTVRAVEGVDIGQAVKDAVASLPANVFKSSNDAILESKRQFDRMREAITQMSNIDKGEGAFFFDDNGEFMQVFVEHSDAGQLRFAIPVNENTPWTGGWIPTSEGKWYRTVAKLDAQGNKVKDGRKVVYERDEVSSTSDVPAVNRLGDKGYDRLKRMAKLRDLLRKQINLESGNSDADSIELNRTALKNAYNDFVKKHGYLSNPTNERAFGDDPDSPLLSALELSYDKGVTAAQSKKTGERQREERAKPAPILSQRVIVPYESPEKADSSKDGLVISLAERGVVDIQRIAGLVGKSEQEVIDELHTNADQPLIFKDPESNTWESREAYLSGNVKRKLAAARSAGLEKNSVELEKVIPEDIPVTDVGVRLGSIWVPTDVYSDFLKHLIGDDYKTDIHFTKYNSKFSVLASGNGGARGTEVWGTPDMPAYKIVSKALNSESVKVYRTVSDGNGGTRQVMDEEATALATQKAGEVANEFQEWVFADADRRDLLGKIYNETYNTLLNRQFDGEHLTFPGKVPDSVVELRRHQKNGIWRIIQSKYTLLDHCVGAGKTFTMISGAMELRRMGLANKPAIVVPNHMVEQFASDVYRLYPGAKILAAGKKDFQKKNRLRLFSKIATGDWDIVIIPHSSFKFIPIDPATEISFIERDIKEVTDAIEEEKREAGKNFGTKDLQRIKEKLEERMKKLLDMKKDDLITFEQMGIDQLFVDEAHEFKNLAYNTRLNGVLGLGTKEGSQRAIDVYNKIRVMREKIAGRGGVVFATGTPISNSIVEMYNLMRYLGGETIHDMGLQNFDAWHKQFAEAVQKFEMNEAGGLVEKTRMARFSNMPELMALYYQFADAVTLNDIKQWYSEDNGGKKFPVPAIKGGKRRNVIVQPTATQESLLQQIVMEFEALPMINDPKQRNAERLRLMDRARKVSLDARAVNPSYHGEDGGKLDSVADNVARIYREWDSNKGTQLVFLDRSMPKSKADAAKIKEYDDLLETLERATDSEEIDEIREKLEKFDLDEMRELRAAQVASWNAYDELKKKFIARGISEKEIAYIHEANTDLQKQALFDKVNAGDIRVLIGSTPKMGAGTNVQQKLVGLHHVDVTWKPSDIEQREGRIERQGNLIYEQFVSEGKEFEVEILAYATERTYDAKMWNIVESKMRFINDLRKYTGARDIESNDEESENMAEMAAMASGDPLMLERVKLDSEIKKMEMMRRAHTRKMYGIESSLKAARSAIEKLPEMIKAQEADEETSLEERKRVDAEALNRKVNIQGTDYDSKHAAFKAVDEFIELQRGPDKKGAYTVKINGKSFTNKETIDNEIEASLGDDSPFEVTVDGRKYISRNAAGKRLAEMANEMKANLRDGYGEVEVGNYLGFPLTLFVSDTTFGLSAQGNMTHAAEAFLSEKGIVSQQSFAGLFRQIVTDTIGKSGAAKKRLADSMRDLPELEAQYGKPFPMEEQYKGNVERLAEVTKILSDKKANKDKPADAPALSASDTAEPVAAAQMLPTGKIVDQVAELLKQFKTTVPVSVIDNKFDVLPDDAAYAGLVVSGITHRDKIFLVRDGLPTMEAVVNTLFHEMLHYGIRRFVPESEYIAQMKKLYQSDPWIQAKAEAWLDSKEGIDFNKGLKDKVGKKAADDISAARAVDEALAMLAEELHSERIEKSTSVIDRLAGVVKNVIKWLADLAAKFKFAPTKTALAELQPGPASKAFVESIFRKLKDGEPHVMSQNNLAFSDPAFKKAWHGSPHDHDKFDSSKIGTGEGAQAYGYGHYFASSKDVAEYYRDALSNSRNDKAISQDDFETVLQDPSFPVEYAAQDRLRDELSIAKEDGREGITWHDVASVIDSFGGDGAAYVTDIANRYWFDVSPQQGKLYQVELAPSEDEYLDWDRPLSEQSDLVREALNNLDPLFTFGKDRESVQQWLKVTGDLPLEMKRMNGHAIYSFIVDKFAGSDAIWDRVGKQVLSERVEKAASDYLHSIGIRGIRYLDGSSRSKGEGNHNYVIFNDEDVSITAKYSKGGEVTNVSPSDIRSALIDRFGSEGISNLESAGTLKVMRLKDAPADVRASAERENASALYVNGVAYLFSDRMTAEQAPSKLLHEIGEHYGLERMIGKSGYAALMKRVATMAKVRGSVAYGAWQGVKANYGEFNGMTNEELAGNERFMHEVLAAIGENQQGQATSLWRELLAKFKAWLADKGILADWMNEGDIANLVSGSLKKVMRDAGVVAAPTMDSFLTEQFNWITDAMKADKHLIKDCA